MRIFRFFIFYTGLSLSLIAKGLNSGVSDSGVDDDRALENTTYLDNDYGYKLGGKSADNTDQIPVMLANNQDSMDDDQTVAGSGCKLPTIPNGSIRSGKMGSDNVRSFLKVQYVCNDRYIDAGNGELRCDGSQWHPAPETLCRVTCPKLETEKSTGSDSAVNLQAQDTSSRSRGLFLALTRWTYQCRADLQSKYNLNLLECGNDGRWRLLSDMGLPVADVLVEDADDLCEDVNRYIPLVASCRRLPQKQGLRIRYKMQSGGDALYVGDEAIISCAQPYQILRSSDRSSQLVFRCQSTGHWSHENEFAALNCVSNGCLRPISDLQLKPVYEEVPDSRSLHADDSGSTVPHGTRVFYKCDDRERYYLVGDMEYVCNTNGTWTPPYWPRCEKRKKCYTRDFPNDGNGASYFANSPADGFEPGHILSFGCADGFKLEGRSELKCLDNGEWNFRPPTCTRDEWSTKRFIAVTSVACLLGVLLVVLLGFFVQRQLLLRKALGSARRHRLLDSGGSEPRLRFASMNSAGVGAVRGHHQHPQFLAAAARTGPAAFDSDPDRLALIAFADGVQVPLPTYEEAVSQAINERRCQPAPFDAISTLSGYCSRAVRRLPSLSSLRSTRDAIVGSGAPSSPRVYASGGSGSGQQRSRLREQWSSTSGSNVSSHSHGQHSRHVGSNETVAVSDVSTNITLETVSTSGQSQTASARAYAGSLSSILSSNGGGLPTTSVPVVALSVCSASSMASSIGGGSTNTSAGASSAMGGSQSEGLPLLESQELDGNQDDYEDGYSIDQQDRQQVSENSDEICSRKSFEA